MCVVFFFSQVCLKAFYVNAVFALFLNKYGGCLQDDLVLRIKHYSTKEVANLCLQVPFNHLYLQNASKYSEGKKMFSQGS